MVLTRAVSNLAQLVRSENTPPPSKVNINTKTLSSRLRNSILDASRRRRARAAGSSHSPRYTVEQAKRRSETKSPSKSVRFEVKSLPSSPSTASSSRDMETKDTERLPSPRATSSTTINLPRYLSRPEYRTIPKDALAAVDPDLENTNIDYIRDELKAFGPGMLEVLASVRADPIKNALPKELTVLVNDFSSNMPSHMLAVYSRQPTTSSSRRRVTLFPTHNVILASYCANLPKLPSIPTPDLIGTKQVTIPVVPLCLPSPHTFPRLSSYLYTKQTSHLLASLLPCAPPSTLDPVTYNTDDPVLLQFANRLAATYTSQALLQHAMSVNALWRNVCALGIFDDDLWSTMDLAWEILLKAAAISTGSLQSLVCAETT